MKAQLHPLPPTRHANRGFKQGLIPMACVLHHPTLLHSSFKSAPNSRSALVCSLCELGGFDEGVLLHCKMSWSCSSFWRTTERPKYLITEPRVVQYFEDKCRSFTVYRSLLKSLKSVIRLCWRSPPPPTQIKNLKNTVSSNYYVNHKKKILVASCSCLPFRKPGRH